MVETPPGQVDHRVRNITRGVSSLSAQNIGTSILAFILLAALTRFLGSGGYGIYSAVLLVVGISAAFSNFGLQLASTRYVAFLREKDVGESWAAAKSTLILSLLFSVAVTAVYSALSPYFSLFFTKSLAWTGLFLLGGLWLFSSSLSTTLQGIIQGLKKYVLLAKILLISRIVMVAFTILVLYKFDSLTIPIIGWIIYYSLIVGWSFKIIGRGVLFGGKKNYSYSTILKYSFPLGIAGVIQVFALNSDSLVVGGFLVSASLGIYNAVIQLTAVLGLVLVTPLITAFFPEASSTAESEVSNAFRLALRFVMLTVLPASFVLAGLSTQLLTLFGGGTIYLGGVVPMELIALFYIFSAIQGVAVYLLQAVGRTTQAMVSGIVSAAVVALGSLSLVPEIGLTGAALARIADIIIGLAVALYYARRYLSSDSAVFYIKCFVSSIVPFLASYGLTVFVSSRTLTLVPYTILSGILFLVCLKVLRVFTEEDRRYISHLLPAFGQRFLKYI